MISRKELLCQFEFYIKDFITSFRNNPFVFLTEADLRASLYYILSSKYNEADYYTLPRNRWTEQYKGKEFVVDPWQAEYPEENQRSKNYSKYYGASKIDIAMISNEDNSIIKDDESNHYLLPVSIAFELKLRFDGFKIINLLNDFEKLKKYLGVNHFLGIAFLFEQEPDADINKHTKNYLKKYKFDCISLHDLCINDNTVYALHIYPDDRLLC